MDYLSQTSKRDLMTSRSEICAKNNERDIFIETKGDDHNHIISFEKQNLNKNKSATVIDSEQSTHREKKLFF